MKLSNQQILRIIIALLLNSLTMLALSQDTLFMRDGSIIPAKIIELSNTEVRFKKAAMPDGPLYIGLKAEIYQIRYSGGVVETLDPGPALSFTDAHQYRSLPRISRSGGRYFLGTMMISESDLQAHLLDLNDPEITYHVQKARLFRGLQNIGFIAIPLAAIANYYLLIDMWGPGWGNQPEYDPVFSREKWLGGAAALCVAGSITFKIGRAHHNNAAICLYHSIH